MNQGLKLFTAGKMSYCIGIDPGKEGAFAVIPDDPGTKEITELHKFSSINSFISIIRPLKNATLFACIEKLGPMPIRGSIGNFKLGHNYGAWEGCLRALEIPYILTAPIRWQKAILDYRPTGRDKLKPAIVDFILRQYPTLTFPHKKDWDKADAMCLALYARDYKNKQD